MLVPGVFQNRFNFKISSIQRLKGIDTMEFFLLLEPFLCWGVDSSRTTKGNPLKPLPNVILPISNIGEVVIHQRLDRAWKLAQSSMIPHISPNQFPSVIVASVFGIIEFLIR